MAEDPQRRPHLLTRNTASPVRFRNPQGGGETPAIPQRDRRQHGTFLKKQLEDIESEVERIKLEPRPEGLIKEDGTYLTFQSDPGFFLKLDSLEDRRAGIELEAVKEVRRLGLDDEIDEESLPTIIATVFVPDGKLGYFKRKLDRYLEEKTPAGQPKNKALVESIAQIGLTKLEDLWTDQEQFPSTDDVIWWETWLRVGNDSTMRRQIVEKFRQQAEAAGLDLSKNALHFPENTVLLVKGTPTELSQSVFLLDSMAEVRLARETAEFFVNLTGLETQEWIKDALKRIQPPGENSPAVCLLDTGVNQAHPLIEPALQLSDMHAYDPNWGTTANQGQKGGHGTEMAGLALYGDVVQLLTSTSIVQLRHRLESVKILPPTGSNEPQLYGDITRECIARAEIQAPKRPRAVCLPITVKENSKNIGHPSSWSSAIDQICAGVDQDGEYRRLLLVSAGNASPDSIKTYPDGNATDPVNDPGQAWNALTVGAYTDKVEIDSSKYPGWRPVAKRGGLCPSSTTSLTWERTWPLKPDIVLEGGNYGINPAIGDPDSHPDSLRLLTTNSNFLTRPLTTTGDTSSATALASRMAAIIMAEYPDLWPETIRALLVHSAWWTKQMLDGQDHKKLSRLAKRKLLRTYGYGVPNLDRALYSAGDSLTLIAQDYLQPYIKESAKPKAHHMNLHRLPWPTDVLQSLGSTHARMRVTLSYFIEPNPGSSRGLIRYTSKYRYASHGLRFDVKHPLENAEKFRKRVNMAAREEDETIDPYRTGGWILGSKFRTRGSIHSDIWFGTAAELAQMGQLAVYPVAGWWKTRDHLKRWDSIARYSLVVTIATKAIDIDIYTPVNNLILIPT